jgi:FkbM family methyltransferase
LLNPEMGSLESQAGIDRIRTRISAVGHALYGPYEQLEPGRYIVEFDIALAEVPADADDLLCGFIDVVTDSGHETVAYEPLFVSQLAGDHARVSLAFHLKQAGAVEYRVHVNGHASLLIADNAVARPAANEAWTPGGPRSYFIDEHKGALKAVYERDARIHFVGDRIVAEIAGVRFNARVYDDVNFVHEIFVQGAYKLLLGKPTCIIDVGLNVALASLVFATRPFVEEIHAFEPFEATRARGMSNIALNPELARKITVNPYGLGDVDGELTLRIYDSGDSGAMSTRDSEYGTPMQIPMRDAGGALRPIIESARGRGLEVIVKVDCEGSEFPVFASLAESGLLSQIRGFMVEWHRVFEGRSQDELIAPLLANDYLVFDISPPTGNGFFYATRFD